MTDKAGGSQCPMCNNYTLVSNEPLLDNKGKDLATVIICGNCNYMVIQCNQLDDEEYEF